MIAREPHALSVTAPTCRHCGAALTRTLVDLGLSPLAPAEAIFAHDYAYFSSFSDSWLRHCSRFADTMTERLGPSEKSLVIEIASNDGYLLQYFRAKGIDVLGIEPAANCAAEAMRKGISTRVAFFGRTLAEELRAEGRAPDLVCAANVLAHVPDINDFVAGIATLLTGAAVFTVEFPHLLNLIEQVQFDTIYHEHYSYLSLLAVERIFARQGLRMFGVEMLPTHGGSLRVHACLKAAMHNECPGVAKVREAERRARLDRPEGYAGAQERCEAVRDGVLAYLREAKAAGRRVAAYGAAAKGNTLLNYAGVSADLIEYAVDRNPAKQDTLLPGSHIPVHGVEMLRARSRRRADPAVEHPRRSGGPIGRPHGQGRALPHRGALDHTRRLMRILVTQASGFLGRHCITALAGTGHRVITLARDPAPLADEAEPLACDLLDKRSRQQAVCAAEAECLIHFAWHAGPRDRWHTLRNLDWVTSTLALAQEFGRQALRVRRQLRRVRLEPCDAA